MIAIEEKTKPKVKKIQLFQIKPYIDETNENMGLTKYNMVIHDGTSQGEQLTLLENNGIKRWLTGLDEFAPEVQMISDKENKEARISEIRKKVIYLEKMLASNVIEEKDPDFWKKVIMVHPKNDTFWSNVIINATNEPVFLNPEVPRDLLIICGIEAGGFSTIAKSLDDAKMKPNPPKFYLEKANEDIISKNEVIKIKNRAISILNTLMEEEQKKMFYVVKNINVSNSYQYKKATSNDIIYNYLDGYITGAVDKSIKKSAQNFIEVAGRNLEELRIGAVIADANFYKIIQTKSDGLIYDTATGSMLGRNVKEIAQYLKNPLNQKIYEGIQTQVEAHWKD